MSTTRRAPLLALLALALVPAAAPATSRAETAPPSLRDARASLAGEWRGELQYRDYQSGKWIPIPYDARVTLVADGVTLIQTNAYDDGPKRGTVYITSVAMLGPDGQTEYVASYRADRAAEMDRARLALSAASDATHWTIVATRQGSDDDRPATIRETSVRDGDTVTITKEVDFKDDASADWLVRNRTVMRRK